MTAPSCSVCHFAPTCAKAGAVVLLVDDRGDATCVRCFTGGPQVEAKRKAKK